MSEEQLFDFSKKTKKPRKNKIKDLEDKNQVKSSFKDPHSYDEMLKSITDILIKNNPYSSENKSLTLKPVQLEHIGSKKYRWTNFTEFTTILKRSPEHLSQFISSEMGLEVIIQEDKLKIEGRRLDKEELQAILKKYIIEYVKCPLCNNANTKMIKDTNIRSLIMQCESCQSQRTVQPIKSSFQSK